MKQIEKVLGINYNMHSAKTTFHLFHFSGTSFKLPIEDLENSQSRMSSEEEDDAAQPPIGDIAVLTASVSENSAVPAKSQPNTPTSARV